ncbi:hypothetical protein ACSBR2_027616 [Camellia fascicularis]
MDTVTATPTTTGIATATVKTPEPETEASTRVQPTKPLSSTTSISTEPTALKCAACGCHRNFHRCEPEDPPPLSTAQHVIEYQPQHRHHPLVLPRSLNSASPSPISSAYYPLAPHMLLVLSAGLSGQVPAEIDR